MRRNPPDCLRTGILLLVVVAVVSLAGAGLGWQMRARVPVLAETPAPPASDSR